MALAPTSRSSSAHATGATPDLRGSEGAGAVKKVPHFFLCQTLKKMGSLDLGYVDSSSPQCEFKPLHPEEFRQNAHKMVNFIVDYYKQIETFPVLNQVQLDYLHNHLPGAAPYLLISAKIFIF
jgi:hypothetical protein